MSARLLDGKDLARTIRELLTSRVVKLKEIGVIPSLAAIIVGDDPASVTYVRMKSQACEKVGIVSNTYNLAGSSSFEAILDVVTSLNLDPTVHGILIQHPLPKGIDEQKVLDAVSLIKDVDGISTPSLGSLVTRQWHFDAATPGGIITLLKSCDIPIAGKHAVVIGRSVILGKPVAMLLLNENATVTICHSKTENLKELCQQADILVAAVGRAEMVKGDWIKEGAVVIDAGYNKVEGRSGDVGDVDFAAASERASWITPVPGGVGPMTIAVLLSNTVTAAELQSEA